MPALTHVFALAAASLLVAACTRPEPIAIATPPSTSAPAKISPPSADEALRALLAADTFEDVQISYDGHLSPGVRSFRAVFAASDAADRFRELFAHGSLVGQLYAAIGLRHHDPVAYAEAVATLRGRAGERVHVRFGCLGGGKLVGELLETRDPKAIRLSRGQTFAEWMAIHKTGQDDIVGGGFTSQFGEVPSRL